MSIGYAMPKLVFGTFMKVIKLYNKRITDHELVGSVVGTIDAKNSYGENNNASYKLINCITDFSQSDKRELGDSKSGDSKTAMSLIWRMAKTANKTDVAQNFRSTVVPILDDDTNDKVIKALLYIINNDKDIADGSNFNMIFGFKKSELFQRDIMLPEYLASILLYTVKLTRNPDGRTYVEEINKDYLNAIVDGMEKNYSWNPFACTLFYREGSPPTIIDTHKWEHMTYNDTNRNKLPPYTCMCSGQKGEILSLNELEEFPPSKCCIDNLLNETLNLLQEYKIAEILTADTIEPKDEILEFVNAVRLKIEQKFPEVYFTPTINRVKDFLSALETYHEHCSITPKSHKNVSDIKNNSDDAFYIFGGIALHNRQNIIEIYSEIFPEQTMSEC